MSGTSKRNNLSSARPLSPETLEGRVLLAVDLGGVTTLASADFNGDAASDRLVFARALQARQIQAQAGIADTRPRSSLFVIDGTTGGVIGQPVPVPSTTSAPIVVVDDFNNDGRNDLLVANGGRGGIELRLGRRGGTFARARRVSLSLANITAVSVTDVNGDGLSDLVVSGESRRATQPRIRTLVPDFGAQLEDAGALLPPRALAGGVTAEAGGAGGSLRRTNPAFDGLDLSGLVGVGDEAVLSVESSTGGGPAGTFEALPGAQGEAGGGTSLFGNTLVGADTGVRPQPDVFVLFGRGNGSFNAHAPRRGR